MAYIRISVMTPRRGHREELERALLSLAEFHATQPGHWLSFRVESRDERGRIGRITAWNDEASANAAALTTHDQSLRSQLNQLIADDEHLERSFFAELVSGAAPQGT
jgi:quinol monooxygenase YgiN